MKTIKLATFLLFALFLMSEAKAQRPNEDPKNPRGCAYQVQGTGGTQRTFHCTYCGLSNGTCVNPPLPPCPACWEAIQNIETDDFNIQIFLATGVVNYTGKNVEIVNLQNTEGMYIGYSLTFDLVE